MLISQTASIHTYDTPSKAISKFFVLRREDLSCLPARGVQEPRPGKRLQEGGRRSEVRRQFSPVDRNSLYTTMRAHKNVVTDAFRDPGKDAQPDRNYLFDAGMTPYRGRIVVAADITDRPAHHCTEKIVDRLGATPPEHLIGVLDDGCPFAAAQFLRALGGTDTQVLGIWDRTSRLAPGILRGAGSRSRSGPTRSLVDLCPTSTMGSSFCRFDQRASESSGSPSGSGCIERVRKR